MSQRISECFLFGLMAVLSLLAVLWFKAVCFENEWLGIQGEQLGFDGAIGWLCVMFGVRHFHVWIFKLFGRTSIFEKNRT